MLAITSAGCTRLGPDRPPASVARSEPATAERRGAPVYEGCYVRFDRPTPTAPPASDWVAPGQLALAFELDPESVGDFVAIELELLDCAGAGFGPIRDDGWRRIPLSGTERSLRLPADLVDPILVARGPLPPGEYHRVFVAVDAAHGIGASGRRVALNAHVEPITRPFTLQAGAETAVTIVLTVQPRPRFMDGGFNLFVREAFFGP